MVKKISNVIAYTWLGGACIAVLVSAAALTLSGDEPSDPDTNDDEHIVTVYRGLVAEPVHAPGSVGEVLPPAPSSCRADYTPRTPAEGVVEHHWDITCDPLEATPDLLTAAAKAQKEAGRQGGMQPEMGTAFRTDVPRPKR